MTENNEGPLVFPCLRQAPTRPGPSARSSMATRPQRTGSPRVSGPSWTSCAQSSCGYAIRSLPSWRRWRPRVPLPRRGRAARAASCGRRTAKGDPGSVKDGRTPGEQRQAERAAIEERLWAGVIVLAEVTDAVIELVREREDDWLADLRVRLEPAREKRREAERLLAEAKAEEWRIHRLGQWLQITSEDGAFGRQPAPDLESPPERFSAERVAGVARGAVAS